MKFFHLRGTIFKEDTSPITENESEEFIKFLENRGYTFFMETELKDTV